MPLDLDYITVQPVLFFAQDHKARNMTLVFDPVATNRFHYPSPDHEGLLRFDCDPVGVTVTSIAIVLDPIRPQIILQTSGELTLGFTLGGDFAEAFGPGGFAAYGRGPDPRKYHRRIEVEKSKQFSLLGVVVQEAETPALIHTVFFTDEDRNRWRAGFRSGKSRVVPSFDIEASLVRFGDPPMKLKVRLAVKDDPTGQVRYLHSSMFAKLG